MGRRKRHAAVGESPRAAAEPVRRGEVLLRLLLGLVTALIVARPLVLGEDAGLLDPLSSSAGLVLPMLALIAGVGWAIYRLLNRESHWHGSGVEVGLGVTILMLAASAAYAAPYKHPAWFIVGEWLVYGVVFCLVRQLVRTPEANRSLLAAVLATGVSLTSTAYYQALVEFPRNRALAEDPERLRADLARQNISFGQDDAQLETFIKRLQAGDVFGTYAHPNAFAGYLALLLPGLVGYALAFRRAEGNRWRTWAAAACALATAGALLLTHSRGAILGSLLAATVVLVVYARHAWWPYRKKVLLGAAAVAGLVALVSATELGRWGWQRGLRSFALRLDYWRATWAMIQEQPWLGVGPGQFGRAYPRYMLAGAHEKITDPHNFILELWSVGGIFATVSFLLGLVFFFRRALAADPHPGRVGGKESAPEAYGLRTTNWEFYLGGMAGLLLAFLLRGTTLSQDEILLDGIHSGVRSVIWFATFALFDGLSWGGPTRVLALATGALALLLNWLVSGGLFMPSVALPLVVVLGLALNATPDPARTSRHWSSWLAPLPLTLLAAVGYFLAVFQPGTSGATYLSHARQHYPGFAERLQALQAAGESVPASQKLALRNEALLYLQDYILKPLRLAAEHDPTHAAPRVELAHWLTEASAFRGTDRASLRAAVDQLEIASRLDPQAKDAYLALHRVRVLLAQNVPADAPRQAEEQYGHAAKAMQTVAQLDPTEARWRYQLAEAFFLAGDKVNGRRQAAAARDLDNPGHHPTRQLTAEQRHKLAEWLPPGN